MGYDDYQQNAACLRNQKVAPGAVYPKVGQTAVHPIFSTRHPAHPMGALEREASDIGSILLSLGVQIEGCRDADGWLRTDTVVRRIRAKVEADYAAKCLARGES